ncbi:hypothetical protein PG993_004845 [Apiospora rasikravindrae]|uniref:Uncharacterized protein n=1 Tax=Apiospora rasikravindrae TaxID=990691 RepID=A0ABR1TDY0_9PEZI
MATRHLDHDTGLVYYENLFPLQTSHPSWDWDKKPIKRGNKPRRKSKGARSLMDMAMTAIGDNLNLLSTEALRRCPEMLVWRTWDHFYDEGRLLNFHGWKTFLETLAGKKHPEKQVDPFAEAFRFYRVPIADPNGPLSFFLNPIRSPDATFLVRLTISHGASFAKYEMLALAGLENLCTLSIMSPELGSNRCTFPRVDDRLVREWSLLRRPFPSLRALRIWGNDFTTFRSLDHVLAFPVLEVYNVAGKHTDWNSRKLDGRYRSLWIREQPEDPDRPIEAVFRKVSKPYVTMFLGGVDEVRYRAMSPTSRYETCNTYVRNEHAPRPNVAGKVSKRPPPSVSKSAGASKHKRHLNITQVLAQFSNT